MKYPFSLVAACLLGSTALPGQPPAAMAGDSAGWSETFEAPQLAVPTWQVLTGNADVTSETSFAGNCSLKIEATTPPGQVAFNLPVAGDAPVTFVDFRLLSVAENATVASAALNAGGAEAGFLQVDGHGEVLAYDAANGQWLETNADLATEPNGVLNQWVRLTVRLDQVNRIWDLYVNGAMVAANLRLEPTAAGELILFGTANAPVYVDNVNVGTTNPLFVDANSDGLPDAWVQAETGNAALTVNARSWVVAGAGGTASHLTLLQLYLQTVATLSQYSSACMQPVVLVHPTIRSWEDMATFLGVLNTIGSSGGTDVQAFLANLANALQNASQVELAGLAEPEWQFAPDLATAARLAANDSTIVIFPGKEPYVMSDFSPAGDNVTVDCLDGVVISTSGTKSEGQGMLNGLRNQMLTGLPSKAGLGADLAAQLLTLWPQASPASTSAQPNGPTNH